MVRWTLEMGWGWPSVDQVQALVGDEVYTQVCDQICRAHAQPVKDQVWTLKMLIYLALRDEGIVR